MRNLGKACETDFHAAGIYCAEELITLGPEKAFIRMLEGRVKSGRSTKCCNALYLYAIYGAIHDIDWRDIPETKKAEFKKMTAQIRASGYFG